MNAYNWVFLLLLGLSLAGMFLFTLSRRKRTDPPDGGGSSAGGKNINESGSGGQSLKPPIVIESERKRNSWYTCSVWWLYINYMILLVGASSSLLVLYINAKNPNGANVSETIIYSIIAAFMTILGYVITPRKHMASFRKAYTNLDNALRNYIYGKKEDRAKNQESLIAAINLGEKIISNGLDAD